MKYGILGDIHGNLSALEAVLAVVYLEGGLDAARRAVASLSLW